MSAIERDIEQRILTDYVQLWNKSLESPFVPNDMKKVYMKSDELIIIDSDFQLNNKELNSLQTGYDTIFPLLTQPWEYIKSGGIQSIDSIRFKPLDAHILTTIEARGELEFEEGSIHYLNRKATQLWQMKEVSGWFIIYEHVS